MCVNRAESISLRLLAVFMVLLLLFSVVLVPIRASAVVGTVTVVGTVVMTLAALADIFMICCGAAGLDGAIRNQASATGTLPMDYMGQLMNRWSNNTGRTIGAVANLFQAGFHYLSDGTFQLDSSCTAAVADFQRWAWSADGADLVDYAPLGEGNYWHYNGINIELVELSDTRVFSGTTYYLSKWLCKATPLPIYSFLASTNAGARYWTCAIQNAVIFAPYNEYAARYAQRTYDTGNSYSLGSSYTLQEGVWEQFMGGSFTGFNVVENASIASAASMPSPDEFSLEPVVIGNPDTFVGPMQQGQGCEISPSFTVSPEAAAQLHLTNYLRARAAAYAGTGTVDVPVTDVGTGEEETLPLSVPLDTPLTVTVISDASLEQSGSIAGSDAVASDFEGLDDYTMDLTSFFPFCIPFDFAALLSKFEAESAAPVVDLPFPNPTDEENPLSVHVDLSPFDSVAVIVRKLELIAFCVGLCLLTKHLIQGGD